MTIPWDDNSFCWLIASYQFAAAILRSTIPGAIPELLNHQFEEILVIQRTHSAIDAHPGAYHLRDAHGTMQADLRRNVQPAGEKSLNQLHLLQSELGGLRERELAGVRGIEENRGFTLRSLMDDDGSGNKIAQAAVLAVQNHGDDTET